MAPPQVIQIPLAAGRFGKQDERAANPPALAIARDVEFDELGGLQTRKPYVALSTTIYGGSGEDIAEPRRLVDNAGELLLFTRDKLYSWSEEREAWVDKGTHLAVATTETPTFVTTGDQIHCDRAELDGTIVYVWFDGSTWVAAIDKTTGAVIMPPYEAVNFRRARVVALETKIVVVALTPGDAIVGVALDPADPLAGISGFTTTLRATPPGTPDGRAVFFDAVKREGEDEGYLVASTYTHDHYDVVRFDAALASSSSNKVRNAFGALAIASSQTGYVYVVRADEGDHTVRGDRIFGGTLADSVVDQNLGTYTGVVHQAAAAWSSAFAAGGGGVETCFFFFSYGETNDGASPPPKAGSVTTAGAIVVGAPFPVGSGAVASATTIASRAFARANDPHVYVHLVFAGASRTGSVGPLRADLTESQVQNTTFLVRDDGFIVAKICDGESGGFDSDTDLTWGSTLPAVTVTGTAFYLPGVALVDDDTYAWCATERRLVIVGGLGNGKSSGYSARAPRDVLVSFDDNRARRCARSGATLYVSGGEVLQYDGDRLTEVGFHVYPWWFDILHFEDAVSDGFTVNGKWTYKQTYRWDNGRGERERSTTATIVQVENVDEPTPQKLTGDTNSTPWTHKMEGRSRIAREYWRTAKDPTDDAPFYLTTSRDPGTAGGVTANRYRINGDGYTDAFQDELRDESFAAGADFLERQELNPENDDSLGPVAPPAANIVLATNERVFLGDVAGDPDRVWYSLLRGDGKVAAFNEQCSIPIPPDGGRMTALAIESETLVVFRERAVYVVPGVGYNNLGTGDNYGPARKLPGNIGALAHEAVCACEVGLVFKSAKGWYLLPTAGGTLQYIGEPVADFDDDVIEAIHLVAGQQQLRILSAKRVLVLDTLVSQWAEWSIDDGRGACVWGDVYAYVDDEAVRREVTARELASTSYNYGLVVETPWVKLNELQGRGRVRRVLVAGAYRQPHRLLVSVARDYQETDRRLEAAGGMTPPIIGQSADPWDAVLAGTDEAIGVSVAVRDGNASLELRDHARYDLASSSWIPARGTVGVLLTGNTTDATVTVAAFEALFATSRLARVVVSSTLGAGEILDLAALETLTSVGLFTGGVAWFMTKLYAPGTLAIGALEQFKIGPKHQRCEAMKIRIQAIAFSGALDTPPGNDSLALTGLGLEVAVEPTLHRRIPSRNKV